MTSTRGGRAASPVQESPAAGSGVPIPQFLPPRPRPQDPLDPDLTTVHPAEATAEVRGEHPSDETTADAGDDWADDADAPATSADGSSPASTGKGLRPLVTAEQMTVARTLVQSVLLGATTLANHRFRQHETDDRFEMTDTELEQIGIPLARILARRSPIPAAGAEASDLADGVEAVVGIIAYTLRQMLTPRQPAPVQLAPQDHEAPRGPFDPYRAV